MESILRLCGKMICLIKATDLYTRKQGERFVIYVTGSYDSSTNTAEEGRSTGT